MSHNPQIWQSDKWCEHTSSVSSNNNIDKIIIIIFFQTGPATKHQRPDIVGLNTSESECQITGVAINCRLKYNGKENRKDQRLLWSDG